MSVSTFFGVELGKRALGVFRKAIDITGHNVANANTPGYHRQTPIIQATAPYTIPNQQLLVGAYMVGTGVEMTSITRAYDGALELRMRDLNSQSQYYSQAQTVLSQIEIMDPLKTGVSDNLSALFAAFQNLSAFPESTAVRQTAITAGTTLSRNVNNLSKTIMDARTNVNESVKQDINDVNGLLIQLGAINVAIRQASASGQNPNDLLDQRDQAVSDLSKLVDVQTNEDLATHSITVYIGSRAVVQDANVVTLTGVANALDHNYVQVKYFDNLAGANVNITNGKLKAELDMRDSAATGLMYYKNNLDTFAKDVTAAVNNQFDLGFDVTGAPPAVGRHFFTDISLAADAALNMDVHPDLLDPVLGPGRVTAASTAGGAPGDGSNALAIAQIQNQGIMTGGFMPGEYFANFSARIGSDVKSFEDFSTNTDSLLTQLTNIRDSETGVSMDEEAANLVEFQKAYQAAAKIVSMYDSLYATLLQMVGVS